METSPKKPPKKPAATPVEPMAQVMAAALAPAAIQEPAPPIATHLDCVVCTPLRHDGDRYAIGATITLPVAIAQRLARKGYVDLPEAA